MGFFDKILGSDSPKSTIQWKELTTLEGLEAIIERSNTVPCAIFKHSTRCSISSMAKSRLEGAWDITEEEVEIYYLDLIQYRPVSNKIAEVLGVEHQSPQIILLKEGKAVYNTSHNGIAAGELKKSL